MTADAYETIRVEREDRVVVVEMHRPEALNALTVQMGRELGDALGRIAGDATVRSVILTGAGRGFSSGVDLRNSGMAVLPSGRLDARSGLVEVFNPIVLALREMPQPAIAAVNGVAAGIGVAFALACDFVIAARSASLVLAFVNVGLVPDGGTSVLVPARAGWGRALELSLLGERVDADQAERWGLVNRVVDDAVLLAEATGLARRLADRPAGAQAAIKGLLNVPLLGALREALAREAEIQGERFSSDEADEAMRAFAERRRSDG
jgi:2-(1,2-epoxy-1,2-dihydrophenyl)acetyl-CoA isomerase